MTNKERILNLSKKELIEHSQSWNDMFRLLGFSHNGLTVVLKKMMKQYGLTENFESYRSIFNKNAKSNIFKRIDTKEKAYWLGFIAADGYVSKKDNKVSFTLSVKDEDQLDKFITFINGDLSAKSYSIGSFGTKRVHYAISNKLITSSIRNVGIVSPKAKSLSLIDFGKKSLNLAYLMGYYDGDGTEKSPELCSGSKKFLEEICDEYNVKGKIKLSVSEIGSAYTLYVGMSFVRLIMNNYKNSMPRKRRLLTYEHTKDVCECGRNKYKKSSHCRECSLNYEVDGKTLKVSRPSSFDYKAVVEQLKSGKTMVSLAKEMNISDTGLRKRLRQSGVKVEDLFGYKSKIKQRKQIISMYKKGFDVKEIACEFVLSTGRVNEIIRDYKVEKEGYKPQKGIYDQKAVLRDLKKTKNFAKTAINFGADRSTIRRIGKKNGIVNFKKK